MPNPFAFISEIREFSDDVAQDYMSLRARIDMMDAKLDQIINVLDQMDSSVDWYGDGK